MRAGVLGVLVALLLAGCSVQVQGVSIEAGKVASSVLGDLRTVDACGYLPAGSLDGVGKVEKQSLFNFDECVIKLAVHGGGVNLSLSVGRLVSGEKVPGPPPLRRGGLEIEVADDGCSNPSYLRFADGIAMRLDQLEPGDKAFSRFCQDAICAVLTVVADRIMAGSLPRIPLQAGSAGLVDLCSLVDSNTLASIPWLVPVVGSRFPAGRACLWGNAANGIRIDALLARRSVAESGSLGVREELAKRSAAIVRKEVALSVQRCEASYVAGPYLPPHLHDDVVQVFSISAMTTGGPADAACDAARRMAAAVWPKLPGR